MGNRRAAAEQLARASFGFKVVNVSEHPDTSDPFLSSEDAANYWRNVIEKQPWYDEEKEHAVALLLNTRYRIKGFSLISIGSLNETVLHPRDAFRAAVTAAAYAVVIMHNHPSGDVTPSKADWQICKRLREVGEILQVRVIDQVIVAKPAHFFSLESCERDDEPAPF